MSNKKIVKLNERITDRDITLTKITAVNLIGKTVENGEAIEDNWKYHYKVLKNSDEELIIKFNADLSFKPESLFDIKLDFVINYKLKEKIIDKEIEENIIDLLSMSVNQVSYIVSFISDRMFDIPYIIPPYIEEKDVIKLD